MNCKILGWTGRVRLEGTWALVRQAGLRGPISGVRASAWRSGAKEGFKQRGSDWEAIESPHAVRRRTGWGAREKAAPGAKTKVGAAAVQRDGRAVGRGQDPPGLGLTRMGRMTQEGPGQWEDAIEETALNTFQGQQSFFLCLQSFQPSPYSSGSLA